MLHNWFPITATTPMKYECLNCEHKAQASEIDSAPACLPDPEPEEYDDNPSEEEEQLDIWGRTFHGAHWRPIDDDRE